MFRALGVFLARLSLCFLISVPALAQSIRSSITGVVADTAGAVVVGAKVTAVEVATAAQSETTTNGSGLYSFQGLLPGTYVVTVTAQGFKELKSNSIFLVAAASGRFDATLDVGNVSDVVEVKAAPPTLITDSAETGSLVTGEDIVREPVQRSTLQLLRLTPGNVSGNSSAVMIGGQRSDFANLTIDGITTKNNIFGGQSGGMTADQSYESIAEVKVIDGNGTAENPGFAGLITTTKGGTNQFHGSAFFTTDNSAFNAAPFGSLVADKPKGPALHWFGGSVGGPVWLPKVYDGHSKTFFFVTWEHRTFPLAAGNVFSTAANLPTAAFQGKTNPNGDADFSSLLPDIQLTDPFHGGAPFAGNIIPHARLSAVALALQNNYYPAINTGTANSFIENYKAVGTSPEHIDRYDIRLDHNIGNRDSLSGRFSRQVDPHPGRQDAGTLIFRHSKLAYFTNMYVAETHTFSGALVNEVRLGYSRDKRANEGIHDGTAVLQQIGLQGIPTAAGTKGFPQVQFSSSQIEGFFEEPSAVSVSEEASLLDNVSWQRGNHTIKTGTLIRYGRPALAAGNGEQQFGSFTFNGFGTGFDYADFLLGIPRSENLNSNPANVYYRHTDIGLFAQDSWHATSKLTLTYGLRWEYFMPPVDLNDRRVNFDPATGNLLLPNRRTFSSLRADLPSVLLQNVEVAAAGYPGRSLIDGRKTNFGPRLGFAYLLGKKTVVRGGYGLHFGQLINSVQDSLAGGGLFGTQVNATNVFTGNSPLFQFPSPFSTLPAVGGSSCTQQCLSVSGTDPNIKTPTSQQWNFTVERELGFSLVARVGYRGFRTNQLAYVRDLTIPRTSTNPNNLTTFLYPLYSSVDWTSSGGIQKANSLDLSLERKFTRGLTFQLSYTLSKNESDVGSDGERGFPSNPYDLGADMGNSQFVPRHRVVNNVVWDVPFGRGMRFGSSAAKPVDYVLGGWEISIINVLQSGAFLTPTYDGAGQNIRLNEGVDLRPDCSGSLSVSNPSHAMWFNTAAFSTPALGSYGNCGVGVIQGPGLLGFSLGLHKSFKLGEQVKLKLEANMMNAFNHPNIGDPTTNLSSSLFGVIRADDFQGGANLFNPTATSDNGERHIWMGLRLEF